MSEAESDIKKGIATRLESVAQEIRELEKAIKFIDTAVDPRVLSDFRQAIDHIRLTAWTVQSWLDQRDRGRDPSPLLPLLTAERIRRAVQLNSDLARDLDSIQLTVSTEGIEELYRAVQRVHRPLAGVFEKHER